MNSDDEIPLTDAQRTALSKVVEALKPITEGDGGDLLDAQEVCIALEAMTEAFGYTHPRVFQMRRALEKMGLKRPPLEDTK